MLVWFTVEVLQPRISTLPETNAPQNKWLEYILGSFWDGLFSGAMLVPGSVSIPKCSPAGIIETGGGL